MKKLFSLLSLLVLIGISANVMGQATINQKNAINATRDYSVNWDGTTHQADHVGNTYAWAIYAWNGTADYSDQAWAAVAATSGTDYSFTGSASGVDVYSSTVTWLKGGYYVVEVTETGSCATKRRIGVQIFDLDLLVKTFDTDGSSEFTSDQTAVCNTDAGKKWTNDDDTNINLATDPALGTMTYTYKVSLYTVKGSTTASDLIGSALAGAKWRFTPVSTSTIPASPGAVTWKVNGSAYTMGNIITVTDGSSEVTITAEIKNIAADEAAQYKLNFAIATSTVNVENGGSSATDYAEGTEPTAYTGASSSHVNAAYEIIVDPIPNTSVITAN